MKVNRMYSFAASFICALSIYSSNLWAFTVVGDTPLDTNGQVILGIPESANQQSIVISRKQYVINWDFEKRAPEWSAWTINKRLLGTSPRSDVFRLDHDLDEALAEQDRESVGPNDYRGSCLDRGHQVPSGDRTASELDNKSTFYMSNILPQSAYLNRKTWVSLERFLRRQVEYNGMHVQVYAGSVNDSAMGFIGPNNDIRVPKKNFKIAVLMPAARTLPPRESMRLLVLNFPNVTSKGTNPVTDRRQACWDSDHTVRLDESNREAYWRPFLSTMAQIQSESKIDFSFLSDIQELTPSEVDDLITSTKTNKGFGNPFKWPTPVNPFVSPFIQSI